MLGFPRVFIEFDVGSFMLDQAVFVDAHQMVQAGWNANLLHQKAIIDKLYWLPTASLLAPRAATPATTQRPGVLNARTTYSSRPPGILGLHLGLMVSPLCACMAEPGGCSPPELCLDLRQLNLQYLGRLKQDTTPKTKRLGNRLDLAGQLLTDGGPETC